MGALVDKSMPSEVALYDAIPHGEGGRQRGPSTTLLLNVALRVARRVPLTKLVELDGDSCPYLAVLIVATLVWAGKTLIIPEGTQITIISREAFDNMLLKEASCNCNNYGLVSR